MANPNLTPHVDNMRSALGRARGLGSARAGAHDWWAQRLTSLALVPLTIWFIFAAIHLTGEGREAVLIWLSNPWQMALMSVLIVATFYHLNLGLQVVVEDYVHHEPTKIVTLVAQKGLCVLLAFVCLASILKIGLRP